MSSMINETKIVDELASIDHDERMAVVAAAIGAVLMVALCVICKVCPGCCLRRYCPLGVKYRDEEEYEEVFPAMAAANGKVYGSYHPPIVHQARAGPGRASPFYESDHRLGTPSSGYGTSGRSPQRTPIDERTRHLKNEPRPRDSTGSTTSVNCSETSPKHKGSFLFLGAEEKSFSSEPPLSTLDVALHYNSDDEKLAIYVKTAKNIPPNLDGFTSDVWVKIVVVRDLKKGWVRKRPSSISMEDLTAPGAIFDMCEVRTQTIRRSLNPTFNEYFSVDLKEKDRKYAIVKFIVCHFDRRGRQYNSGQCHVSLGRVDCTDLQDFQKKLIPYRPQLGQLEVTLNYLPTAERLCVVIGKASKLRFHGLALDQRPSEINAFVKLVLLHRGKPMPKQTTSVHYGTTNPDFQETFTFDLPQSELERTVLVLVVAHQQANGETANTTDSSSSNGHISDDPFSDRRNKALSKSQRRKSTGNFAEMTNTRKLSPIESTGSSGAGEYKSSIKKARSSGNVPPSKSYVIGRLAFGCNVPVNELADHWNQVMVSPRLQHSHKHTLLP